MNRMIITAGLLLVCSAMNLYDFIQTNNGFSLVFGFAWLLGSLVFLLRYLKEKKNNTQEEEK